MKRAIVQFVAVVGIIGTTLHVVLGVSVGLMVVSAVVSGIGVVVVIAAAVSLKRKNDKEEEGR